MKPQKNEYEITQKGSFNLITEEIAINRVINYTNDPEKHKGYIEMRADIIMMKG